jgi:hypothetical protein
MIPANKLSALNAPAYIATTSSVAFIRKEGVSAALL